jgi:RNA polymerase sigma-70 factor (ECF subfamily)
MPSDEADRLLVARIRRGDQDAWRECIALFEGRLLAFVDSRLRNRTASEDVVQETFLGFLISLPNYDEQTPLDMFLFSIASHKLTDLLRKQGRRPTVALLSPSDSTPGSSEPAARDRAASSLARSQEQRRGDEILISAHLGRMIRQWFANGEFERLKCIELLFVAGWQNKHVAAELGISEQAVANHKHFVVTRLRDAIAKSSVRVVDFDRMGLPL